jgi:hypothetical protein
MRRPVAISIFVCVITVLGVPSYEQTDLSVLEQSIKRLEDPDWKNRRDAFFTLLGTGSGSAYEEPPDALSSLLRNWPQKSDEIKLALIQLLAP